jgi:hypothetical protein
MTRLDRRLTRRGILSHLGSAKNVRVGRLASGQAVVNSRAVNRGACLSQPSPESTGW